jgi:hypothetical protein
MSLGMERLGPVPEKQARRCARASADAGGVDLRKCFCGMGVACWRLGDYCYIAIRSELLWPQVRVVPGMVPLTRMACAHREE